MTNRELNKGRRETPGEKPSDDRSADLDAQPTAAVDAQTGESVFPAASIDEVLGESAKADASIVVPEEWNRLSEQVREANDRALRAQAELENFRKRMRREMEEERRYAGLSLISDLLGALDHLQLALEASEQNEQVSGLREGVRMVASQILAVLDKHQCRPLDAVGALFDPHEHQALAQEPSSQYAAGFVTRVVRAGYRMHDRVVRPCQVFISSGPAPITGPDGQATPQTTLPDKEPFSP